MISSSPDRPSRGIDGSTRLYAVLGDPVRQVRVPGLLNPMLGGLGAVLVPVHVRPADLAAAFAGLALVRNLDGLFVTVPHKAAVCRFADELGPAAAAVGAANVLCRRPDGGWRADNVDGVGFVRGLTLAGHRVAGRRFAVVGAGGAGSAVAAAVLAAGASAVAVADVDRPRRDALLARLDDLAPRRAVPSGRTPAAGVDVVVNATPLGMRPDDPLPFDPAAAGTGTVVADLVMTPRETALLRRAAELGLRVHHGHHMLDQQLDGYVEFFGWPRPASVPGQVQ